jgi:hypothetical protein
MASGPARAIHGGAARFFPTAREAVAHVDVQLGHRESMSAAVKRLAAADIIEIAQRYDRYGYCKVPGLLRQAGRIINGRVELIISRPYQPGSADRLISMGYGSVFYAAAPNVQGGVPLNASK